MLAADLGATHAGLAATDLAGDDPRRGGARDRDRRRARGRPRLAGGAIRRPGGRRHGHAARLVGITRARSSTPRACRPRRRSCRAGTATPSRAAAGPLRRPRARGQRRQPDGARGALPRVAGHGAPDVRQGRHRHRRGADLPRPPLRGAQERRRRHRAHPRARPRRRVVPLRPRLPGGGRRRRRACAGAPGRRREWAT